MTQRREHEEVSAFSLSTVTRKISNTSRKSIWYNLNTRQTLPHGPAEKSFHIIHVHYYFGMPVSEMTTLFSALPCLPIRCSKTVAACSSICRRGDLSLLCIDLVLEGANVAFYPLYCGLEGLLCISKGRCIRAMLEGTYVNVFGQELVGNTVLVNDIVVHARAGCRRTEKESEKSRNC